MRVLHAIASLDDRQGGPSAALVGLALAQRRRGLDITILTIDGGHSSPGTVALDEAGIDFVHILPAVRAARFIRPPCERVVAAVAAADVVHVHGVWDHPLWTAAAAASRARVPYLIRPCGMLDEWALRRRSFRKRVYLAWRLRRMLEQAAAVHCTTRTEARSTGRLGVRFPEFIIEPNGIRTAEFEPLPPNGVFRTMHGIGDRPLVVFLGRVHPGKGVEYLFPAIRLLRAQDPVVAIVGPADSAFAARMKREAAALAPSARVIFTGMLRGSDRISPLVDADVCAFPSEHENFGIAVIEALAAGCPVVVSDQVALCQEISTAGAGSISTLDPDSIAAGIDAWLDRATSHPRPFAAARRFALNTFDWNRIAANWEAHYSRLAAARLP